MRAINPKPSWTHALILLIGVLSVSARAQSTDSSAPAPIRSNEINASIAPRDLGDARLTDHYYAFTGTAGDLTVTVQSSNLNGDIDVFTANGLRPLLKFSIYVENPSAITKGIFLHNREDLILRVEARTPNDDEGSYRISFGGTFIPILGGPEVANDNLRDESTVATRSPGQKGRRVSSSGARINEPEPPPVETAAATPAPTPEATPEPSVTEKPAETEAAKPPAKARTPRSTTARRSTTTRRSSTTASRRSRPVTTPPPSDRSSSETETAPVTPTSEAGATERRGNEATNAPPASTQEVGPRLVIETVDGTLVDRSMTTVRRVTVENGVIVIVGRDGKIQRVPLANVLRMSIAP